MVTQKYKILITFYANFFSILDFKSVLYFHSVGWAGRILLERPEDGGTAGLNLAASILGIPGVAGAIQPYATRPIGLRLLYVCRT